MVERAAGGETNRDIAQALFVTPKTVEVHLSNAYRKLGVRSRRELRGARGGMTLLEREPSRPCSMRRFATPRTGAGGWSSSAGRPGSASPGCSPDLREARGELRVLSARAGELEREFGFGVVRQLFEGEVADGAARSPARPRPPARYSARRTRATAVTSFAALHGLFWLAANLAAERPLLLAIDDLHWCDRPSLRFVAYLARRLEGLPILIAATVRAGEPGADPALLAEVVHDPGAITLLPGPLSAAGRRPRSCASGSARRGRRVLRRLPRGDRRQPAAAAPARARAGGRGRRAGCRQRRRRARRRAARGVEHGARAARPAAGRRRGGRARGQRAGRGRGAAGRRRARGARRAGGRRRHR